MPGHDHGTMHHWLDEEKFYFFEINILCLQTVYCKSFHASSFTLIQTFSPSVSSFIN